MPRLSLSAWWPTHSCAPLPPTAAPAESQSTLGRSQDRSQREAARSQFAHERLRRVAVRLLWGRADAAPLLGEREKSKLRDALLVGAEGLDGGVGEGVVDEGVDINALL